MEFAGQIMPLYEEHRAVINELIVKNWAGPYIVTLGVLHDTRTSEGFVAVIDDEVVGYVLYNVDCGDCEIIVLESMREGKGIGRALVQAVKDAVKNQDCGLVRIVTTNDNTRAMRFYQRIGFTLKAVHMCTIQEYRENIKPEIPILGFDNILIAHEFEFVAFIFM